MKDLLITGGLGYVGSFTSKLIKKNFPKIISIDNLSRANLYAEKFCKNYKINLHDKKKVKKILLKHNIKTVFHLAAFTCVRESLKKKKLYKKNNYIDQIKFIKLCKSASVKNFIFSSSLSIYDKNNIKKDLSPYSKYKLKIEKYLKKNSSKNFKVIILRYPNISGASIKGDLGDRNFHISRIFRIAYSKIIRNKKITIFLDNKKKFPIRNYVHVIDIAKINFDMIKMIDYQKKNFVIYDIQSKLNLSNFDIIKKIFSILKKETKIDFKLIDKHESFSTIKKKDNYISKNFNFYNSKINTITKSNLLWFKNKINKKSI